MKKTFSVLTCCMIGLTAFAQQPEHLKSVDLKGISKTVSPKADFFNYVNEGWCKDHPLTPEYSRYGQFNVLTDSSNNRIKRIVTHLKSTNPQPGTDAFKIATIYEQVMDSVTRNKLGIQPIKAGLDKIEKAAPADMDNLFLWMHKEYGSPFFNAGHQEDMANSQVYAMYAGSTSLGMGDRDYYLLNDKRNKEVRNAYTTLIQDYARLAGYSAKDAKRIAKNVLKIETALADSAWTREQSRNIPAMYNPRDINTLKATYPNIPWDTFFVETMGINTPQTIIVTEESSLAQANKLLASTTDREKKDYYLWQYIRQAAPYLSDNFTDAAFKFNKVMSGVQTQRPRWKRALSTTENLLGEAIGHIYVDEYFPASSKEYMKGLVENLRNALAKHIMHLPWMSDDTKVAAMKKLNAVTVKIGYPDKWEDYSAMEIDPSKSLYENVHSANMWAVKKHLDKWGKPVDKTEWGMLPQQINAYYNPLANEIVFPAGILQAPFFDPEASDAENYGGIGVVIGHELTHGFDDQGCNFDEVGNMRNWWTEEDAKAFATLTQGLVEQFNQVEVLPGLKANGQYTLGENIADQGGLRVARTAFLDSQKKKGVNVETETIDGVTPAQAFYMNYANIWAQNIRDEEKRLLTVGDVHSLGDNRVNVSLRNIEPFFEAFDIKEGDPLFRPVSERVVIW